MRIILKLGSEVRISVRDPLMFQMLDVFSPVNSVGGYTIKLCWLQAGFSALRLAVWSDYLASIARP
eukprot:5676394-Amphidinium_carterae.1